MKLLKFKDSRSLLLCTVVLCLPGHVYAERIYKSIDADGNVTYSSHPPSDAVSVETITLTPDHDVTPDSDTEANIEAIKKMAEQLEIDRKQREQKRERAQQQTNDEEQKQVPAETIIRYYPVLPYYYTPYFAPPRRPHPHRPRPPYSSPEKPLRPPLKQEP